MVPPNYRFAVAASSMKVGLGKRLSRIFDLLAKPIRRHRPSHLRRDALTGLDPPFNHIVSLIFHF